MVSDVKRASLRPAVTLRPPAGWTGLGFGELKGYRDLLYFLVWRDIKVRYKQTALGAAWAVLQPFLLMVIFSIFLGRLAGVPSDGFPYPVFAYSALVPWMLFASSLMASSETLVGNTSLVSKVYFPRLILPIAAAGSFVLDFLVAFTILVVLMAVYGITPTVNVLWVPLFSVLALLAAIGVGLWFAALNVKYRDVRHAVPLLVQVWLFATPIAYPSSIVPAAWRWAYGMNPMAGVVEGFRWALLGTPAPSVGMIVVSTAVTIVALFGGLAYFRRAERDFADLI